MLSRLLQERQQRQERVAAAPSLSPAVHRIRRELQKFIAEDDPPLDPAAARDVSPSGAAAGATQRWVGLRGLPAGTSLEMDTRNPYEVLVTFDAGTTPEQPWAGRPLTFRLVFTERFPYEGPRVRFVGPFRLFHPNIECGAGTDGYDRRTPSAGAEEGRPGAEGEQRSPDAPDPRTAAQCAEDAAVAESSGGWGVCLGIQLDWRPTFTLTDLLLSLWVLLEHPNLDDPLPGMSRVAAEMMKADPKRYAAVARQWAMGHYVLKFRLYEELAWGSLAYYAHSLVMYCGTYRIPSRRMLKTVLLLDGSEAMNSAADYQPSYLLAIRQPLLHFVKRCLASSTLASIGVVVMREGVARCELSCTNNAADVASVLEADYFLYGGSGCLSLENGLRATMAELIDDPQKLLRRNASGGAPPPASADPVVEAVDRQVILISAAVTVVDPSDVFSVIRFFSRAGIRTHVLSLLGPVHVFSELAHRTGGTFYCPRNYGHCRRILSDLALGQADRRSQALSSIPHVEPRWMVPVGFPKAKRIIKAEAKAAIKAEGPEPATASPPPGADAADSDVCLVCPECEEPQNAIPSTCRRCGLRLCSPPFIYAMFTARNHLLPATAPTPPSAAPPPPHSTAQGAETNHKRPREDEAPNQSGEWPTRGMCELCAFSAAAVVRCRHCSVARCADCEAYCRDVLHLCPSCIAL